MEPRLPRSVDGLLGDGGFLGELERWAAEAKVDEAALSRARERWLLQQASEDATLVGALVDLAERSTSLVVTTASGRRHRGVIHGLGVDFCSLRSETGQGHLIRLGSLTTVRTMPSERVVSGDRALKLSLRLADVLLGLAAERPDLLVVTRGDETVRGQLRAVGTDMITVRGDGQPPATIYVPIESITEITQV